MLDRRYNVEQAEAVKTNCQQRGVDADVDRLVELELRRRPLQQQREELNRRANEVSKSIGKAKDQEEREARKEEGRQLREQAGAVSEELQSLETEIDQLQRGIPNMSHAEAPVGDESASRELRLGEPPVPKFDFQPRDHVELAEALDILDLEGGAHVAGHGFYFLKNEGVLLDLALQRFALDVAMEAGFAPTVTPDLARNETLHGVGYIPRGPETQIYSIADSDLSLIATAEITLGGLYAGQTLESDQLPLRVAGISHCFRTEAGAGGRAARGLYRVHQFTKVELFAFTLPEASDAMHDELLSIECQIFDALGVP